LRTGIVACLMLAGAIACAPSASAQFRVVPESSEQIQLSFAPLVKKVAPAVVNIFTRKNVAARQFSPLLADPFFRRFFDRRYDVHTSLGTGVIVRSDGPS